MSDESAPSLSSIAVTLGKIETRLEQIADDKSTAASERRALREKHSVMSVRLQEIELKLTSLLAHDLPPRVTGLEKFRWQLVGLGAAFSLMSGVVSGVIVALIVHALID